MEEGIREALLSGVVAGYPVIDIRIVILGGMLKEGETTPLGCKIAASTAFRDGCLKADPILLDPIMLVDVHHPYRIYGGGDRRHQCPSGGDPGHRTQRDWSARSRPGFP